MKYFIKHKALMGERTLTNEIMSDVNSDVELTVLDIKNEIKSRLNLPENRDIVSEKFTVNKKEMEDTEIVPEKSRNIFYSISIKE